MRPFMLSLASLFAIALAAGPAAASPQAKTALYIFAYGAPPGMNPQVVAHLRRLPDNAGLVKKKLTIRVDGSVAGSDTTDQTGSADYGYQLAAGAPVAKHTCSVEFAGDADDAPCSATSSYEVTPSLVQTFAYPRMGVGRSGATAILRGFLCRLAAGEPPLAGEPLTFCVNGVPVGTAVTGSDGNATLRYSVPAGSGDSVSALSVYFAGDKQYFPSGFYGSLYVFANPIPTTLSAPTAWGLPGATAQLIASLVPKAGGPQPGLPVKFKANGSLLGSAVTDSYGIAALRVKVPPDIGSDTLPISAEYAGDASCAPSTSSGFIHAITDRVDTSTDVELAKLEQRMAVFRVTVRRHNDPKFPELPGAYNCAVTAGRSVAQTQALQGKQTFEVPLPVPAGGIPITVSFPGLTAGQTYFNPSSTSWTFNGKAEVNIFTRGFYARPGEPAYGRVVLSGVLPPPGSTSTALGGQTIKVAVQGLPPVTTSTNSDGVVSMLPIQIPMAARPGDRLTCTLSWDGNGTYDPASATTQVSVVNMGGMTRILGSNTAGPRGGAAIATFTLVGDRTFGFDSPVPLPGRPLRVRVEGGGGLIYPTIDTTITTDDHGVARLNVPIPKMMPAGYNLPCRVTFAGDAQYQQGLGMIYVTAGKRGSQIDAGPLVVLMDSNYPFVNGSVSLHLDGIADTDSTNLAGNVLTFSVQGSSPVDIMLGQGGFVQGKPLYAVIPRTILPKGAKAGDKFTCTITWPGNSAFTGCSAQTTITCK